MATKGFLVKFSQSLHLAEPGEWVDVQTLVERFDVDRLPREPWVIPADLQRSMP